MATPTAADPQNPYQLVTVNDLGADVVQKVVEWYRGNRNILTGSQQTAVITAITGILNGTLKV